MALQFPPDRYYDRTNHLWVKIEANGQARIGIDALGLETLGDLVYIALPEPGTGVNLARPMGSMEAAKMTGELIAPISGAIAARNERVLSDPSLVNRDNYGEGWLVTLTPNNWTTESAGLVSGAEVPDWAQAEIARYKNQGWIND